MPASTPSRSVLRASGLMRSTSASPASMSTPASLYERGEGVMGWAGEPRCAWPDRICPILASARLAPVRSAPRPRSAFMDFTTTQKHVAAWLLIAFLAALALWLLGRVLTPFIVAAVLAYALTPLVDRLDALGRGRMPRFVAVAIVELLLILVLVSLVLIVVPVLAK